MRATYADHPAPVNEARARGGCVEEPVDARDPGIENTDGSGSDIGAYGGRVATGSPG
jgi:hypothetical protein